MVKAWPIIKIGEVFDFKNGLSKGKEFFGHGTPFISYVEVYKYSGLTAADIKGRVRLSEDEIRKLAVRKNDVFFTRTSETPEEVGYSAVLLEDVTDCVFNGFVLRARPKNCWLLPEYCKYCFSTKAVRDEISKRCKYTTRAGITGRALSEIEIPLPPVEEQKAIAETLTSLEIHIDNLRQLIEKKTAIRDGTLEDLVSGRTRLTEFSDGWITVPIGDILDFKNGLNKGKEYFGHGTPIVNYMDVYHHSGLFASDIKGTVSLSRDEIKHFAVRKNDVFFTRTSETPEEVGLSAVLLEEIPDCVFSGFVLRGRPKKDILISEYCKYCFSAKEVREKIISNCTYTTRALTNGRVLSEIEILVPPKTEQKAIADVLTAMDDEIKALEDERDKMIQIREGAMDDLLTGRVRLSI